MSGVRESEKARLLTCARRCTREPLTEMGKMGEKGEGAGRAQVLSFVVYSEMPAGQSNGNI